MDSDFPLGQYILELVRGQHLSMREASMKAGLAPETISQILRRGSLSRPRPETLEMIADALGGDYTRMMILAGHLPSPRKNNGIDPELRAKADELIAIWEELKKSDPESANRLMRIAILQAEMVRAAARSAAKAGAEQQGGEHQDRAERDPAHNRQS